MDNRSKPRKWRLERQKRRKGVYFVLASGSRSAKQTIGLGYVDAEDAEIACQRMSEDAAKTHGTPREGRLYRLYVRLGRGPFLDYLTDRSADEIDLLEATPDYASMPLQVYVDDVYGPWRSEDRPKTWRTESHDWTYLWPTGIGDVALSRVDAHRVDRALSDLRRKRGGEASANQKRKCRNALSACITYAYRMQHRPDPCPDWFRLRNTSQSCPPRSKALTVDEVEALIEHSVGWDGGKSRSRSWSNCRAKWRALWAVLFGLGLRPGEAAGLRWGHLDFVGGEILVAADGGKTARSRDYVPMLPLPRRHLAAWRDLRWADRGPDPEALVFPAPGGKQYVTTRSSGFAKSLRASAKAAGIERRVTPYWGRHTAATLAFSAGASADDVARLLRHTSPDMLRRHYDHSAAKDLPGLTKFGDIFGKR